MNQVAAGSIGLSSGRDLEAWFADRPPEVWTTIAVRAALRTIPFMDQVRTESLLVVLRALHIALVAARYPARRSELAPMASIAAAHAAGRELVHTTAADAANSLAHSGNAARSAATLATSNALIAAIERADATDGKAAHLREMVGPLWDALHADIAAIESGEKPEDLASAPLWSTELEVIARESGELQSKLRSLDDDWSAWADWYNARLRGSLTWPDLTPKQNEEVEVAIATLPDELWRAGAAAVNAEIGRLIEQARAPVPRGAPSEVGQTAYGAGAYGAGPFGRTEATPLAGAEDTDAETPVQSRRSTRKRSHHNLWLCQYVPGHRSDEWKAGLAPHSSLRWFTANERFANAIEVGDPIIFWRAINPKRKSDRGGLIGTGRIASTELEADTNLNGFWFHSTVKEFFEQDLIPRERVIDEAGLGRVSWRGGLIPIPDEEAERINELLLVEGHSALFTPSEDPAVIASYEDAQGLPSEPQRQRHETEYVADRPETARDLLRRAPLAFALAAQINRIWDAQTKGEPERSRWRRIADALHFSRSSRPSSQADEAAFILHIDAPWGGGKTTFANFIARILNPGAFGLNVASADGASLLKALPLNDDDLWKPAYRKRRWHVVHFNAWQNEHVSPPWWNFYESIRRQCLTGLALASREPTPKTGEERGTWSTFPLRLAGRGVWLWFALREWLWKLLTPGVWRNLLIFAVLFVIVLVVWNTGWFQTLTAGDTETPRAPQSAGEGDAGATTRAAALGILTVLLTGGAGITVINLVRSGISFVVEGLGGSADATSLGQADPLFRFQRHFSWFVRQLNEPVLVIVDDLDRCKPEYVVELVRGLLTIFRSSRVVFLLLGDKAWIEEAFAQVHENMAKAHTDAQITFGGRFAEKAIQLSFILPEATDEQRNAYLVAILTGKLPVAGTGDGTVGAEQSEAETKTEKKRAADLTVELETFEKEVRQDFSTAHGTEDLVRMKTAHRSRIGEIFQGTGDGTDDDLAKRFQQAAANTVDVEAVFRSATSEQTEQDIRHGIEPVAPFLPGNPRRIKRIVNMVSAFQESGQISEKIDPLSLKWRQLVLWTVIMSEYPQAWRTMVLEENVAREVIALMGEADSAGNTTPPALKKNASDEEKARRPKVASVVERPSLIRLLRGDPFNLEDPDGENHAIDEAALVWLRRLTPLS